jgi:hypothetical protein
MSGKKRRVSICGQTLIPFREVAEILDVDYMTLVTRRLRGTLMFQTVELGRRIYVNESVLRGYIKSLGITPNF